VLNRHHSPRSVSDPTSSHDQVPTADLSATDLGLAYKPNSVLARNRSVHLTRPASLKRLGSKLPRSEWLRNVRVAAVELHVHLPGRVPADSARVRVHTRIGRGPGAKYFRSIVRQRVVRQTAIWREGDWLFANGSAHLRNSPRSIESSPLAWT
jgi:hypothetical protein